MIPAINASKIYSTLGNNSSLVPLAVKDVANSLGLTAGSYIVGDKLEGKDRFMDEFGTQAIWLFGLPVFKKLTDLTLYKALKIDPKADVRLLKKPEILDKAIEFAPNNSIKNSLLKLKDNPKFAKNLALTKFGIATALTITAYTMLTKFRHKKTKEAATEELMHEYWAAHKTPETSFGQFVKNSKKTSDTPAFTGNIFSKLQNFMFDPVKNLMIVDGSITTQRLTESRNKQDFLGYTIKEGATWAFMYFASKPIQNFFESRAVSKHNKSIDLDARIIESEELKNAFQNENIIKNSLNNFPTNGSDAEVFEYLHKNPDDFIVKMTKKCDEVKTLKSSNAIDTRKFIDFGSLEEKSGVKGVYAKLKTLYEQYTASGNTVNDFLKTVKKLKRSSVLKNMGICITALGIATPAAMVAVRYLSGDKDFRVKEDLAKEIGIQA